MMPERLAGAQQRQVMATSLLTERFWSRVRGLVAVMAEGTRRTNIYHLLRTSLYVRHWALCMLAHFIPSTIRSSKYHH